MVHEDEAFTCRQLILPLTTLKVTAKGPVSEALLRRRLLSLSEAAREALVGMVTCELGRRGLCSMTEDLFDGLKRALVHHPEATAIEVARVHAAGSVVTADAWGRMREHRRNTTRLAREAVRYFKLTKRLMHPVASDRFHLAQLGLQETTASDEDLTDMCGGVSVCRSDRDVVLLSEHGFVVGVQVALEVLKSKPPEPLVVCQSCCNPMAQWEVCEWCFDHIFCPRCARDDAALETHARECARSQALVRQACEETRSYLGASPTHVTVLQLHKDAIMPVHIPENATTDYPCPSSVIGRFLRAPCGAYIASLYEAQLMRFLAETSRPEPSDSAHHHARMGVFEGMLENIMTAYESACLRPAETRSEKPARLSKAELRRLRIEKAQDQKEADATAATEEAARQRAEADGILARQTANAAHSSVLSSVLAKRAAMASPEAVARARKRRDELLGAERVARRQAHSKISARSSSTDASAAAAAAAARGIQTAWRRWRRQRRKDARARRRRAARCIQLAARQWVVRRRAARRIQLAARQLLARSKAAAVTATSILVAAPPATPEAEDDTSCVVCLERRRSVVVLPCRHLSLCEVCAPALVECPMCRGAVSDTLVVFV